MSKLQDLQRYDLLDVNMEKSPDGYWLRYEDVEKLMNGWRHLPDLPEKGQLCLVEGRDGGIYFGQFMPNENEPLGFDWWAPVVDRHGNEVFASGPWDQSYEIDNIRLEGAKDPDA